jgi:hypothetical protein
MAAIDFPNSPAVNDTFTVAGKTWIWTGDVWNIAPIVSSASAVYFGANFDGMGAVVLVNTRTYFRMPAAGGINAWSIVAEGTSPTCTLDIWKIANGTALPTVANTITASAKPELTTGNAVKSTTLTGWTTNFSLDDIFCVNVDACSAATKISLVLYI